MATADNAQQEFNRNATKIAEKYLLDFGSVTKAFEDKPQTLSTLFNRVTRAEKNQTLFRVLAVAGAVSLIPPATPLGIAVTAFSAWRLIDKHKDLKAVGEVVKTYLLTASQSKSSKAAPAPSA